MTSNNISTHEDKRCRIIWQSSLRCTRTGRLSKDLRGVVFRVDFVDDTLEEAIGIEDEGFTKCAHGDFAVIAFLSPGTESLQHSRGRITQQGKGQVVFLFELDMRSLAVLAHTIDLITLREESMVVVAEIACFRRTPRRGVLRIEIDDSLFANQVLVRDHWFRSRRLPQNSASCLQLVT